MFQKVVHFSGQVCYTKGVKQLETIKKYLQKLDIEPETTDVYIELIKLGPSSALQLTRATKITRTQIYRHLEHLQSLGLASAEKLSYGTLFRALPLENLEGTIANKEAENAAIRRNLGNMGDILAAISGTGGPKATIQHYYGQGGLKQVNWNLTKAEKEFKVFEVAHLSHHLDVAFARRCRERYIEKGLTSYDLTNATTVIAKELEPFDPSKSFSRHIDPKVLTINFEMYIYNDVVTLVDYSKDQPMALEIHHPALKMMMEQLFDSVWATAKPLKLLK